VTAVCRLLAFLFAFLAFAHPPVYDPQPSPTAASARP
jgi:hypothetical protein